MIEVLINNKSCWVPTELSEISLSSYVEFNSYHKSFVDKYNEGFYDIAIKDGYSALACVVEGFDQIDAEEISIGSYAKESKEGTLLQLLYLINSVIVTYVPDTPSLLNNSEMGYRFTYKDKEWVVPMVKLWDGTVNPDLTYGQYIEAMETIRLCNSLEEKTPTVYFSELLRVLAATVREYGTTRTETLISLRQNTDTLAKYFEQIDMKTGLDVFFCLNGTIAI